MRKVRVNLNKLADAFDRGPEAPQYYLDLETGEILFVTPDDRMQLEELYEELDGDSEEDAFASLLEETDLPDWEKDALAEADRIERGLGERYIETPSIDSRESYRHMEEFIETVRKPGLQRLLERAIAGRGAFRRFKDTLLEDPEERQRWFAFKQEKLLAEALGWLKSEGLEALPPT